MGLQQSQVLLLQKDQVPDVHLLDEPSGRSYGPRWSTVALRYFLWKPDLRSSILYDTKLQDTNICKFPVLEDHEIMICAEVLKTFNQPRRKVLDDIDMCLRVSDHSASFGVGNSTSLTYFDETYIWAN